MHGKRLLPLIFSLLSQSVFAAVPEIPVGVTNGNAYRAYVNYQKQKDHKAFAASKQGASSWAGQRESQAQAIEAALKSCNKINRGKCTIIDTDGKATGGMHRPEGFMQKTQKPSGGFEFFPADIRDIRLADRYKSYLGNNGNKAFAVSTSGVSAWAVEMTSLDAAKKQAIERCNKRNTAKDKPCKVVDANGKILTAKLKFSEMSVNKQATYPELPSEVRVNLDDKTYQKYKSLSGHKAVASTPKGDVYYVSGLTTAEFAQFETQRNCEKKTKTKCQMLLVDNELIYKRKTSQAKAEKKSWHGRYEVDLSNEPELAAKPGVKSVMPSIVLEGDQLHMEVGGNVVAVSNYKIKGKKLSFEIQGKPVNAEFGDKFDSFVLDSGNKPKYVKAN